MVAEGQIMKVFMYPAFVRVPAVGEQELQMSHVDLPQRNAVALRQRQSNFIHAVIQGPAQTDRKRNQPLTLRGGNAPPAYSVRPRMVSFL